MSELVLPGLVLAALAAGAALAARRGDRTRAATLAALMVLGGVLWATVGAWPLRWLGVAALVVAGSAAAGWAFRWILLAVLPARAGPALRAAPLTAAFGMLVILVFSVVGLFAPLLAPYGEAEVVGGAFAMADGRMWLGGDQLGRDLLSRLIFGTRNTVGLALLATTLAFVLGASAGLYAAVRGGWVDQALGRIVDVVMSVPSLIFALLVLSILGTSLEIIVVIITVVYAPRVFRLTRAVAGDVMTMDYIEAARLRGEGDWHLIRREILPNASAPLIAEFGLEFCFVFLLISGLSFLGLGIQPPAADWGSMVRETATLISFGVTTPLIPAAAIATLTVAVNFVVDWMLHRSSGLKT